MDCRQSSFHVAGTTVIGLRGCQQLEHCQILYEVFGNKKCANPPISTPRQFAPVAMAYIDKVRRRYKLAVLCVVLSFDECRAGALVAWFGNCGAPRRVCVWEGDSWLKPSRAAAVG